MDALLRRRSMIAAGGGSPTPPGPVTTIPYIRGGSDGSYIDTGITPDNTTRVVVWARNWNPYHDAYNWLFGGCDSTSSNAFLLGLGSRTVMGKFAVFFGANNTHSSEAFPYASNYHKYELSANGFYVDDIQICEITGATFSSSRNIHLFGINNGGTHNDNSILPRDIFACQIYKNNVLVRDYSAVNTPSIGLYDSVSNTLFTNAGSGSFTYGEFRKNAYTPLEYIECSASQYFDTGNKGTYSLSIIAKFRPTSSVQQTRWLLGARTSASSGRCDLQMGDGSSNPANKLFNFCYNTQAISMYNTVSQTNSDLIFVKSKNTGSLYKDGAQLGNTATGSTNTSFATVYNIVIGGVNLAGTPGNFFYGRIYYTGIGDKNFVPAKVNNVAGMYDTYNDVFYPSASGTDFVAGPEL